LAWWSYHSANRVSLSAADLPPLRPVSREAAALEALAAFAARQRLGAGDRLPTERELAQHLGISRATVREALKRWEGAGLVESRQGSGTFLRVAVAPGMRHLTLTLPSAGDLPGLFHTLEVRRALEAEAAALCAVRAGTAELALIEERLEAMEAAFHARDGMSAVEDWEFHQTILRSSGNPLFEQLTAAMHETLHRFWEWPLGLEDFGRASFPFHRTLVERIRARDPAGARAEVGKLIATVEADLQRGARQRREAGP
jgi:GntR family transcriptional regulator, transcriptional repressor for pyruvate dehydrogenase complex